MGQAKQRGTREERIRAAVARNLKLQAQVDALPAKDPIRQFNNKYGIQRTAGILAMLGMAAAMSQERE